MAESSTSSQIIQTAEPGSVLFGFRPWVKRAGLSILAVAAALSALLLFLITASPDARYGWATEPFVMAYLAVLWLGGAKVATGTYRPIAVLRAEEIVLRPLHLLGERRIPWLSVEGTEQMIRGDRLIVYYRGARGRRFVALNLNLVKGRREFLMALEERLAKRGFVEKIVGQSRYLTLTRNQSLVTSRESRVAGQARTTDPAPGTRDPGPRTRDRS